MSTLELAINMGDVAKSSFLQFLSLFLFFSLNGSISKNIRGIYRPEILHTCSVR